MPVSGRGTIGVAREAIAVADSVLERTYLEEGITIVSETVPSARSVSFGFWVQVGSVHEDDIMRGASHFIEHLIFKGTEELSAKEVSVIFDSMGAQINAFTGKEYTCFYGRLLDERLEEGYRVMSQIVNAPAFRQTEIDFEREVILEEISMYEDSPDDKVHDLFAQTAFADHALGSSILGTNDTIRAMSREQIAKYYEHFYGVPNITVTASGSLSHAHLVQLAEDAFGTSRTASPAREPGRVPPAEHLRVEHKDSEQVHLCYGVRTPGAGHPERYALAILDTVLGGGMSSRLFQSIREERGLAYAVYSYHTYFLEAGYLAAYVGTRPANVTEAMTLMKDEFDAIAAGEIDEDEVEKAREHLKGSLVLSLESTAARMMRIGRAVLSHEELLTVEELIARLDAVTIDEVKEIGSLLAGDRVITAIGPVSEDVLAPFVVS